MDSFYAPGRGRERPSYISPSSPSITDDLPESQSALEYTNYSQGTSDYTALENTYTNAAGEASNYDSSNLIFNPSQQSPLFPPESNWHRPLSQNVGMGGETDWHQSPQTGLSMPQSRPYVTIREAPCWYTSSNLLLFLIIS